MHEINDIHPELIGIHALNSFADTNSASRLYMMSGQFSQRLVVHGATEKTIHSGLEPQLGQLTFSIRMPERGRIIKTIEKYPKNRIDIDAIPFNPETLVIYEDLTPHPGGFTEIGCFTIPYYCSLHQYFGFRYQYTSALEQLTPDTIIQKDTVFADSPSIGENGAYKFGVELNAAYMTLPGVAEDSILISKDILPKLKFSIFEKRVIEFGARQFPINLYGTPDRYKPFPEIGETIGDHGILAMLRNYDYDVAPVEMSSYDLKEPDYIFDKPVYVRGPGGRIVDIEIYHDENDYTPTPLGVMDGFMKYTRALRSYYQEILKVEEELLYHNRRKYGNNTIRFKPEFSRLAVEARAVLSKDLSSKPRHKLIKQYRKTPLDDFRVKFVIEYEITPGEGNKLSDLHGGKGVISQIVEPEHMPVDADGNRADIIMDSASTVGRMNLGKIYEQYIGASARDMAKSLRHQLQLQPSSLKATRQHLESLLETDPAAVTTAINRLIEFYSIVSPKQERFYAAQPPEVLLEHLAYCLSHNIALFIPTDNEPEIVDIVKKIEQFCPPTYGPVTYVGNSGVPCQTVYPIRIGPVYYMLLDKIADDNSACASVKCQYLGIITTITKNEKFSVPFRNSGVRTVSETEARIYSAYTGRESMAEIMDRNNCPSTHRAVIESILSAERPTAIPVAVDRNIKPFGGAKPIQLFRHIAFCTGWKFKYEPEDF